MTGLCAFLMDVVVGELCLRQTQSVLQLMREPLCPVVGVQISGGPVVDIPFLPLEDLKCTDLDQHDLPRQVEESYREGGKFVFQRGKSCLYTASDEADVVSGKRVAVSVVILNGLCCPSVIFGRCETTFTTYDQSRLQQLLKGKLNIFNDAGEIVAYITLSVSLRILGKDVALHAQGLGEDGIRRPCEKAVQTSMISSKVVEKEDNFVRQIYIPWQDYTAEQDEANCETSNIYRLHKLSNMLQQGDIVASHNMMENYYLDVANSSRLEQCHQLAQDSRDACSNTCQLNQDPSEVIATKIAAFEKNLDERCQDNGMGVMTNWNRNIVPVSYQPAPILYTGQDMTAKRLWNEKMSKMGNSHIPLTDPEDRNLKKLESESDSIPKERQELEGDREKSYSDNNDQRDQAEMHKNKSKQCKNSSSVHGKSGNDKYRKSVQGLQYPTGWLRTTPLASPQKHTRISYPKLNRTVFLRRVKIDPQLAHQFHEEVTYQVNRKLRHLDEKFEAKLTKIKGKRPAKCIANRKLTVGCQTVIGWGENVQNAALSSQGFLLLELTNSPDQDNQDKNKEVFAFTKEEVPNTLHESNKEDGSKIVGNGIVGKIELRRNLTFDIDGTGETEINIRDSNDYGEDFEISDDSQSSSLSTSSSIDIPRTESKNISKAGIIENSQTSSLSSSESELEQKSEKISTSRLKESKLQDVSVPKPLIHSDTYVKEPSLDPSLTFTVCKEFPLTGENVFQATVDNSKQNSQSRRMLCIPEKRDKNHGVIKNLSRNNPSCSRTSEYSGASDISAEVCKEILKGRQADFLTRNGTCSQFHYSDKTSSTPEEIDVADEVLSSVTESSAIKERLSSFGNTSERNVSVCGMPDVPSVNEIYLNDIRADSSFKHSDGIGTVSSSAKEIKEKTWAAGKLCEVNRLGDRSDTTVSSAAVGKYDIIRSVSEDCPSYTKNYERRRASERSDKSVDGSISDISARIAALLMPKRVSVAHLNTDSVSSYVPSEVSNTLSSLSDMVGD